MGSGQFRQQADVPGSRNGKLGVRAALHILLVEDDPNDERIIRNILKRSKFFDCSVVATSDLKEAQDLARSSTFDVMILDFWVKAEDSLSMLTSGGADFLQAPAIVVSSLDMTDVQSQSLTAGAMAYLHKNDLSASAIDATLRTLLHSRAREEKLRRNLAQKHDEQRALRDNTAEMAQEIMSTLNAVHSIAGIMTDTAPVALLSGHAQAYPVLIRQGSERLMQILQRYLSQVGSHAIASELRYEEGCLIDLVDTAVSAMAKRCAAKHQEIDVVAMSDRLLAQFDHAAIHQLMVNLISNAHTYSPAGSPIRITLEQQGDSIRIAVIDQGVGMSQAQLGNALMRHARIVAPAELAASGNGLGFAVVTSIIDMHGATLSIDSAQDWGTTVTVTLPRRRPTMN